LRLDLLEKYFLELSRWTKFSTELNRVWGFGKIGCKEKIEGG
jgi:hypothetical protein